MVLRPGLPHVSRQVAGLSSGSEQRQRVWSGPRLDFGTARSESQKALSVSDFGFEFGSESVLGSEFESRLGSGLSSDYVIGSGLGFELPVVRLSGTGVGV